MATRSPTSPLIDIFAQTRNYAGGLTTLDAREFQGYRQFARLVPKIKPVEAARLDLDQHLIPGWDGIGDIAVFEPAGGYRERQGLTAFHDLTKRVYDGGDKAETVTNGWVPRHQPG